VAFPCSLIDSQLTTNIHGI
ncbi:hypothetical protein CCACVL1_29185, partial [Corchorus capsularis]